MMIIILRQSLIGDDYFHMINVINNDDIDHIDHIDHNDVQWSSHPSAGMVEILSIYSVMASLKIYISIGVGELAKLQNLRVYWKNSPMSKIIWGSISCWWVMGIWWECCTRRNACCDPRGPSGPRRDHIGADRRPLHLDRRPLCRRLHRRCPARLHSRWPGTYMGAPWHLVVDSPPTRSKLRPLKTKPVCFLVRLQIKVKTKKNATTRNQTTQPIVESLTFCQLKLIQFILKVNLSCGLDPCLEKAGSR